jgi:ubiquinone/menaquinone biosynthesis C-methylase UbiE
MGPRPASRDELAATFTHPGVAHAYQFRPPYPAEVLDVLEQITTDRPRRVLDMGAGEGALARPLARRFEHVDALDISPAMVEAGRRQPGGRRPNLRWIVGAAETGQVEGPYALVTAGASMHWMRWKQTLARIASVLTPNGFLAIVDHGHHDVPWSGKLTEVIARHSRNPGYDPSFSVVSALTESGLMNFVGQAVSAPVQFRQPVAAYIEQFHSTSALAREWMPGEEAAAFDLAIEEIVRPYAADGMLDMEVVGSVGWGRPTAMN